ncbi:MAG: DUF5658 family protein [bacterium]
MICPSCGMDEKYDKIHCSFCGSLLFKKIEKHKNNNVTSADISTVDAENEVIEYIENEVEQDVDADNFDKKNANYFWISSSTFVLLSIADVICSWQSIINGGMREANNYALRMLMKFGSVGFIYYKTLLVIIIIAILWIVAQYRPRTALTVMVLANILMGALAVYHILIIIKFITPANGIVIR